MALHSSRNENRCRCTCPSDRSGRGTQNGRRNRRGTTNRRATLDIDPNRNLRDSMTVNSNNRFLNTNRSPIPTHCQPYHTRRKYLRRQDMCQLRLYHQPHCGNSTDCCSVHRYPTDTRLHFRRAAFSHSASVSNLRSAHSQ